MGDKNPVVVPMKLITPYNEPAKFGAKSCEFCRLVKVEAPLNPKDIVIIATHQYGCWPTYAKAIKHAPGRMCAKNLNEILKPWVECGMGLEIYSYTYRMYKTIF